MPFVKKGRYGVVHGSIEQHFNPYHALIETGSLEDLKEDELVKKVSWRGQTVNLGWLNDYTKSQNTFSMSHCSGVVVTVSTIKRKINYFSVYKVYANANCCCRGVFF